MTNIEAMKLALDALCQLHFAATERDKKNRVRWFDKAVDEAIEAITALRQAISEAESHIPECDVFFICDAYESGFGHGAKNDGLNDGSIFADKRHGEAYELGYAEGLKRSKREQPAKQCNGLLCNKCGEYDPRYKDLPGLTDKDLCKCEQPAEQEPDDCCEECGMKYCECGERS